MKVYDAASIRNVALVGHSGSGKTQLASAMLVRRRHGQPVRQGRRRHDRHRLRRRRDRPQAHASRQPRLRRVEQAQDQPHRHAGHRQLPRATRAPRCGSPRRRSSSSTRCPASRCRPRRSWAAADELGLPRLVVVNRLDRERASLERSLESLRESLQPHGRADPAADRRGAKPSRGVVDLVAHEGVHLRDRRQRQVRPRAPMPADMATPAQAAREALIEMVAEADDTLMENFFEAGTLTQEELVAGLAAATAAGEDLPAGLHVGAAQHRRPAAARRRSSRYAAVAGRAAVHGARRQRATTSRGQADEKAPCAAFVWKTIADPFAGRITLFRVVSGTLKSDSTVHNMTRDTPERLGHLLAAAGQDADARARDQGRRPRRGRQAEGHADQRHARRQGRPVHVPADHVPGAGARPTPSSRRAAATKTRSAPRCTGSRKRIRRIQLQPRPADQGAAALGPGPAAHRGHGRQAEAPLRRRREPQAAAHPLPRDDQGVDRGARPPQEADRRPRPVRRLQDQGGAAAARRRLRVRRRHLRRLDSAAVRPGRREGHPGRAHARLPGRLPDGRLPGHASSTARTTTSTRTSCRSRWPARWRSRTR